MKKYFLFSLAGAFIGGSISSIVSPRMIAWYFEPPVEIGVNCRSATEWAMEHLQWAQFGGMAAGAVLALIIHAVFFKNSDKPRV